MLHDIISTLLKGMNQMRTFCTEGPINTESNYYVPRTELINEGLKKVDEWRYFTIFAPRQSGKTTYFQLLIKAINNLRESFLPIWISFEDYAEQTEREFLTSFSNDINNALEAIDFDYHFKRPDRIELIKESLKSLFDCSKKEIILIVDEIEGLQNKTLFSSFMHMLRKTYHLRQRYRIRSVILTGVSNITGIIQETASPFNISDQINVPYFTQGQVFDLLSQHEEETGQVFETNVKEGIYENTKGQPGLVGALARDLVEKKCPAGEKITRDKFYKTIDDFTRIYIDKNISNVVSKAKHYPALMKDIIFGEEIPFNNHDDSKNYLYVNGVIDDCEGFCCIRIPLYKRALYAAFKPMINGEREYFKSPVETYKQYVDAHGTLDVNKLIKRYIAYVKDRGNIIFSEGKAEEGIYHYNIDAFFSTYAEFAGAKVYVETPTGGGRVDLLLIQQKRRDIIEIKLYDIDEYEDAKRQLYAYLERSGESEGFLVFFSEYHSDEEYAKECIKDKTEHIWIIPVKRNPPSKNWKTKDRNV